MARKGDRPMSAVPAWLPALLLLEGHDGLWERYLEAVYEAFRADFIESRPIFRGRRLGLKRLPMEKGKEATFWHLTSEGRVEADRTPDLRRCERIRWPRPCIELADEKDLRVWVAVKNNEDRIHIWVVEEDYVVVLADRKTFLLPWTAFLVTRDHTRSKLEKEYQAFKKAELKMADAAPKDGTVTPPTRGR
jgi:hypothetical protein